jgi:hypothetical protein
VPTFPVALSRPTPLPPPVTTGAGAGAGPQGGRCKRTGRPVDVAANFAHYGLAGRLAGLLVADMHNRQLRDNDGGLEGVRARLACVCVCVCVCV